MDRDGLLPLRDDLGPEEYAGHVAHWHAGGASIVGGCCGTGPEHIEWLRRMMDEQ
jgi:S-methylmethionine-dependent homocysteine/selenocysteine methylase